MKTRLIVAILFLAILPCFAQTADMWAGASLRWSQYTDPQVSGAVHFAKRAINGDHPTYIVNSINIDKIVVNSWKPLNVQVMTSNTSGVMQHLYKFRGMDVFGGGQFGPTLIGGNVGTSLDGVIHAMGSYKWMTIGPSFFLYKRSVGDNGWALALTLGAKGQ